jgi:short-subunit dehydrogenase
MPRDLRDKVIIITGASAGIGEATALQCAEAGMHVVANARRADRLSELAGQIERRGRQVELVVGDVADGDMVERLLDAATARFGGYYAVFANAGYGLDRPVLEVSDQEHRRIFDVNYFASVDLVREAARRLIGLEQTGHLLMCSSCVAKFTLPGHSAYSATKAAQNHICRAMGVELKPHGIHVSSVHPVTTRTEFFEVSRRLSGNDDGSDHRDVPDHTPRLFVQSPERVARAVVRCLRRPRPEVWTSHTVRLAAAMMTLSPRMTDVIMRRSTH